MSKTKTSSITLALILVVSAIVVTLPAVSAQQLIMNVQTEAIVNFPLAVDLNGPTTQLEGLKFAYLPPGATEWVITTEFPIDNEPGLPGERYVTDPGGDCDITVTFTQTGEYKVKWVHPASGQESNIVTVTVLAEVTKQSYAYLGVMPNPVGVNQVVLLHVGITEPERRVDFGWKDLSVTIEKPDGTTETITGINTDATGGTGVTYTPTMVGTYRLQTLFPKQQKSDGITMLPSESEVVELVVQQEPTPYYPGHSLPKEYWTRPIDAQLREWHKVCGNWLGIGFDEDPLYAPYNEEAPESAHILWTRPLTIGGLIGAEYGGSGEHSYGIGDAYEGKFPNRIIMAGRLYYTVGGSRPLTRERKAPQITYCVDLHTGEELWHKVFLDNRTISFATTIFWDSFNYHGGYPYLFITRGSTWYAFDADTGDWRFTVRNVPRGDVILSDMGEPQVLNVDTRNHEMSLWAISGWIKGMVGSSAGSWGNNVEGQELDAEEMGEDAYLWTVGIPDNLIGGADWILDDRVIGASISREEVTLWGISLEPGREGDFLFQNTWQAPDYWEEGDVTVSGFGGGWILRHDNVAVLWVKETREYYGFSLETGEYLWGPTEPEYYLNAVDDQITAARCAAYGNLYTLSLGGIVNCYDIQTGVLKWSYEADDPYQEFLFANNWWGRPLFVADGKIYLGSLEHSPINPMPRGAPFYCLDAETGELIWRADGLFRQTRWGGRAIIGDSIIATMDTYDQRIYAIGKGPSAITLEKPLLAIPLGSRVTIQGTVMDVSPGTEDPTIKLRFPYGVPAVSDESMSEWMLYVYKNFERPADVTGVTVKLEAVDPNGNYQYLGTTTSDAYGNFGFAFKPEVEGKYMIIATFEGSRSYYGSTATAYLTVDLAPSAAQPIEPEQPEAPFISTEVLVIVAVIVAACIGLAGYWVLRRRK